MKGRWFLLIGGVLMILVGLARGAGGFVLLLRGAAADPNIKAVGLTVSTVGAFLLLLGSSLVVAAVGVLRQLRSFWILGIACAIAFVIDGAINGYVLYGRPGDQGTIVNAIMAALIVVCLICGKRALRDDAVQRGDATHDASRPL